LVHNNIATIGGYGALLGIEIVGGVEAGKKFINNLKLLYHVANIGDNDYAYMYPTSLSFPKYYC